tara:strand:+ start:189 stop:518 length:330 start_codon:yes stop_codon:yes gene_type:complete
LRVVCSENLWFRRDLKVRRSKMVEFRKRVSPIVVSVLFGALSFSAAAESDMPDSSNPNIENAKFTINCTALYTLLSGMDGEGYETFSKGMYELGETFGIFSQLYLKRVG